MWNKEDIRQEPSLIDYSDYVRNKNWDDFINYMMEEYQTKPIFEFSKCCPYGWNISFKKSGRALCRCYPMDGYFIVLVVIGKKEKVIVEKEFDTFKPIIRDLYKNTKEGMNQRWLMIEVEDAPIIEDIKRCIQIRAMK